MAAAQAASEQPWTNAEKQGSSMRRKEYLQDILGRSWLGGDAIFDELLETKKKNSMRFSALN
jgi:hypothetical protein